MCVARHHQVSLCELVGLFTSVGWSLYLPGARSASATGRTTCRRCARAAAEREREREGERERGRAREREREIDTRQIT